MIGILKNLYNSTSLAFNSAQSALLFAIRVYWGTQLAESGWGKLHNLDKVTEFFSSLNLPMPHTTATFVALVELLGGIFFALGLFGRLTSLVLFINMTVAYITASPEALAKIFSDPDKFSADSAYVYWFASLLILILGPGLWAADTLLDLDQATIHVHDVQVAKHRKLIVACVIATTVLLTVILRLDHASDGYVLGGPICAGLIVGEATSLFYWFKGRSAQVQPVRPDRT
jgi:putative oxidoreductase